MDKQEDTPGTTQCNSAKYSKVGKKIMKSLGGI